MKLATLRDDTRDGRLLVVTRDGRRALAVDSIAKSLQAALDDWDRVAPALERASADLNRDPERGFSLDTTKLAAPLPRAYEWLDGSAYLSHVILVRKARGAEPPATLREDPLVYQGASGVLLGPRDPILLGDVAHGLDFEAEICVILGDTPEGTSATDAARHVRLFLLANDITLRNLVPSELAKGFGFVQSKPATAFSPFAITADELGSAYREGRVHLRLRTEWNGVLVGDPEAGEPMHFSFFDLIAHVARTRSLTAGTILGSGTVSNDDPARGVSCIAERRMREVLEEGAAKTPFLVPGDRVRIEMLGPDGVSLFGAIEQEVVSR